MTKKTDQELTTLLVDTRAALRTESFAAMGARAKDPAAARTHRATIARILTEQRNRANAA